MRGWLNKTLFFKVLLPGVNLGSFWMKCLVIFFREFLNIFRVLQVVNGPAERPVKEVQDFAQMTRDPADWDNVMLVANDHGGRVTYNLSLVRRLYYNFDFFTQGQPVLKFRAPVGPCGIQKLTKKNHKTFHPQREPKFTLEAKLKKKQTFFSHPIACVVMVTSWRLFVMQNTACHALRLKPYRYIQKYQTQLYICRSTKSIYQVFFVVCVDMHINPY